ncbi:putative F-box/LRR-repeat protein At3g49150 [Cicer arietinum]|uniref:F-box/LRR-repeat protein At3g49150 n=1 Tax=Cicer arietinum TaxID=3827 RepID=A0A1S2XXC8_CICAR|nr:putative F-box/LRR-repeat protein At3g49150 [Cicer arietinum]
MEPPRRSERLRQKRDRLSDLPNAILLHIMSFMMIKDIVKTSTLSKRWKNLWKHLSELKLNTFEFKKPWFFAECVSDIVSSRSKGNYPLKTLDFNRHGSFQHKIFSDLIEHAINRGVQKLRVVVPANVGLPYCVFTSHSLTSLYISASIYDKRRTRLPNYLDLPSLTSLHLDYVGIQTDDNGFAEPFSSCNKLNNLFIKNCCFVHPRDIFLKVEGTLHVTNATLTNLTINNYDPTYKYVISAPNLTSFIVNDSPFQPLDMPCVNIHHLHSSSSFM